MKPRLSGFVCASALFLSAFGLPPAFASVDRASASSHGASQSLTYIVKPGDTLIDLANSYLNTPSDYVVVQQLNNVANPRRLRVGQSLVFPVNLLKTEAVRAEVSSFRGPVTLDSGSGARAPETRQAVTEGTLISTGANASIRLSLTDGSHIVVPSNSRVRLSRLRRFLINGAVDHDLEVQRGRLESRVAPRQFPGGYRVTTPVSVSAVRGTDFRISLNANADRASTEVLEGRVEVAWESTGELSEAVANQAISISSVGMVHTPLPPAPDLHIPQAILNQSDVSLRVIPQAGAVGYRGRLALDAGMVETIAESESETGSNVLNFGPLEDGLYYLSLSSIDHDGIEGQSNVYNLVRISHQSEANAASGLGDPRRRTFRFRWEAGGTTDQVREGDFHYRFVLHRKDDKGQNIPEPVLDRIGLEQPYVSVMGLTDGVYEWTVQKSQTKDGQAIDSWSQPRTLRIGQ